MTDTSPCALCSRPHHGGGEYCGRCLPIVDGVERLRRRRPFVIVAPSSFPPFEDKVISGDEALWTAQARARELTADGVEVSYIENERTGQRWAVTG